MWYIFVQRVRQDFELWRGTIPYHKSELGPIYIIIDRNLVAHYSFSKS